MVSLPGYEDYFVTTTRNSDNRVRIELSQAALTPISDQDDSSPAATDEDLEARLSACQSSNNACQLLVFDFLVNELSSSEVSIFHELHIDRLGRGLQAHFNALNLLQTPLQVSRCSAYTIKNGADATRVATALSMPVILWGFIEKQENRLASLTNMTIAGDPPVTLFEPQQLGSSVIEFAGIDKPVDAKAIAATAYLLGEYYQRNNRTVLALQAYLHAREQNENSTAFSQLLEEKIQTLQQHSLAMHLTPISNQ